jgi:hypothetical protein
MLRVFTCNNFRGHWPVGTAAVVVARNKEEALSLLLAALEQDGLSNQKDIELRLDQLFLTAPQAYILNNGEY